MDAVVTQLAEAGFDVAQPFDTATAASVPGWERLAGAPRLGLLVGNTRALWPRFVAAMRDPELAADPDPLDRYTERSLEAAFPAAQIYYGHRAYDHGYLPFQRLAVAIGLGTLAPSQLVIHPIYGPWFALRAVVVRPGSPPAPAPRPAPCPCEAPCSAALTTALAARGPDAWRAWVAVREACVRQAWRYDDDQVRYHYTKAWIPAAP